MVPTPATAIRPRLWRALVQPAVLVSFLLHVAAIGGALYLGAPSDTAPPPDVRVGLVRLQDRPQLEDPVLLDLPPVEVLARREEAPEIAPLPEEALLEQEPTFATEAPEVTERPPIFDEIPLRVARRRLPQAPAPVPVRPAPVVPPVPVVRPPVRVTPRPTPPAAQPVAQPAPRPVAARPAPARLRILYAPDARRYYPLDAQRRGLEGTAVIRLLIDAHGRVVQTSLARSSGYPSLDRGALAFAAAYRFSSGAGLRQTRLPVTFRMPRRGGF